MTFNPSVKTFRLHWYATVPCCDLVLPQALSQTGREVFNSEKYYAKNAEFSDFYLSRLGRRSRVVRTLGRVQLKPHRFWSMYMSEVADDKARGAWFGLAPYRVLFKSQGGKSVFCLPPKFTVPVTSPQPSDVKVSAYPKAYVWPIGWTVGVVLQIEGLFGLSEVPTILDQLRTAPVFLAEGRTTTLLQGITELDAMIRNGILQKDAAAPVEALKLYSTSGPIVFEGQPSFHGLDVALDLSLVSNIIGAGPSVQDNRRILTPAPANIAMTIFNRGTFQVTGLLDRADKTNEKSPACALSNLKNALLMSSIILKYHQKSNGSSDSETVAMRYEVAKTFEVLQSKWENPHFRQICEGNESIQKLLETARSRPDETISLKKEVIVTQRLNTILAFTFGAVFLAAILILVVLIPNPTPPQFKVFSVVMALAAGGIATTISGMMNVTMTLGKRIAIGATGALAVFVIVYFFVPAMAK